jgi:hypothetical protein
MVKHRIGLALKHILALTIQNTCSHLQILTFQEVCDSKSSGVWWSWIDGLLLLLLLGLSLLLSSLLLCNSLRLHLLYKFRN